MAGFNRCNSYTPHLCRMCKKRFIVTEVWRFKDERERMYFCSWGCMQKARAKGVLKEHKLSTREKVEIMIAKGKSEEEICRETGCTLSRLWEWYGQMSI